MFSLRKNLKKIGFIVFLFHYFLNLKNKIENIIVFFSIKLKNFKENKSFNVSDKKHILVFMYKYIKKTATTSNETYNLLNTLTKYAQEKYNIEVYYYEDYQKIIKDDIDIVEKLYNIHFDYIIMSSYSGNSTFQPKIATFNYIKKNFESIQFINLMWDSASEKTYRAYKNVFDISDLSIIIDGSGFYDGHKDRLNLLKLYTPQDQSLYCFDSNLKKDIDVLFLGSKTSYRSNRNEYLNYLQNNGVNIMIGGGGLENPLSAEEYAKLSQRAKIIINFSFSVEGKHQLKGRVFEAMHCGACLFESNNNITSTYFRKGVEYVEFSSKEDLLKKIEYYLKNEDEMFNIALDGHKKVIKKYTDIIFWDSIFSSLEDI